MRCAEAWLGRGEGGTGTASSGHRACGKEQTRPRLSPGTKPALILDFQPAEWRESTSVVKPPDLSYPVPAA